MIESILAVTRNEPCCTFLLRGPKKIFPRASNSCPRASVRLRNSCHSDGNNGIGRRRLAKVTIARSLVSSLHFRPLSSRFVSTRHLRSCYRRWKNGWTCGCQLRERMEGSIDRFWSDYERVRSCLLLRDPGLYIRAYRLRYDLPVLDRSCLILRVKGVSDCVLQSRRKIH